MSVRSFSARLFILIGALVLAAVFFYPTQSHAQIVGGDWEVLSVEQVGDSQDVICHMPTSDEVSATQVDPFVPERSPHLRQEGESPSQFDIHFDFEGREEFRDGVTRAAKRWSRHIRSPIPISINIELEELPSRTLAVARMAPRFLIEFRDGRNQERTFIFPPPLASYLSGQDLTPDEAHFTIAVHPDQNWYFGDGTPGDGEYDFVSVMMHEIAHGLGFFGSMDIIDGQGIWPGGEDDVGLPPYIYDGFSIDMEGTLLTNTNVFPNPSHDLGAVLRGETGGVYFRGTQTARAAPEGPAKLYAPGEFNFGNSYSHLDQETYPAGAENSLMKPRFAQREVVRTPGSLVCGMLADIGWGMGPDCFELLGGHILAFDGRSISEGLEIYWKVEDNSSIDQFVVESLYRDAPPAARQYETIATLHADEFDSRDGGEAHYRVLRSDLSPGRHLLRLRVLDADGNEIEVSPEQQITMPVAEATHHISSVYPNPVSETARIDLTVTEQEQVTMHIFDSAGRRIISRRRALVPNIPSTFEWDASSLSSGTYFIRFTGESFSATDQFTVVR